MTTAKAYELLDTTTRLYEPYLTVKIYINETEMNFEPLRIDLEEIRRRILRRYHAEMENRKNTLKILKGKNEENPV